MITHLLQTHELVFNVGRLLRLVLLPPMLVATVTTRAEEATVQHSYLVLGSHTAIIDESGNVVWEHDPGSRDGFVLPNGNVLLAYANRVEEVTREKEVVFHYALSNINAEMITAQRLYSGNTSVVEMGQTPRLLELNPAGQVVCELSLQPETNNYHMLMVFENRSAGRSKIVVLS